VSAIYKLAAVEHAILGTRNWLNLLDFNDLNILEVASDLKVLCLLCMNYIVADRRKFLNFFYLEYHT